MMRQTMSKGRVHTLLLVVSSWLVASSRIASAEPFIWDGGIAEGSMGCRDNVHADCMSPDGMGFADPCESASCPANPAATCHSNWCVSPLTYKGVAVSTCKTLFVNANMQPVNCDMPVSGFEWDQGSKCPDNIVADCIGVDTNGDEVFQDPCTTATCPGTTAAACYSNLCASPLTYKGVTVYTCKAMFVDANLNPLVCGTPKPTAKPAKVFQWDQGSNCPNNMHADCIAPSGKGFASPCSFTKCPSSPSATCHSNMCGSALTFAGVSVPVCKTLFVDANLKPVDCNKPAPSCGSACKDTLDPVCANKVTYPNSCLAACMGVKQSKGGRCKPPTKCSGVACKQAAKGDLCSLASKTKQCTGALVCKSDPAKGGKSVTNSTGGAVGKCMKA